MAGAGITLAGWLLAPGAMSHAADPFVTPITLPADSGGLGDGSEPPPKPFIPDQASAARPAKSADKERVLVLFDGRVLSGKIEDVANGYMLTDATGRQEMLANFLIRVSADSLDEAYEKLRDAMPAPRPDDHAALADWCVKQGLYDAAKAELMAGLEMDAGRTDLRESLAAIEAKLHPERIRAMAEEKPLARDAGGFVVAPARPVGSISKDSMTTFGRNVQPLLLAKCGNASCHGVNTTSSFQLQGGRAGRSPAGTRENLKTVLSRIDIGAPQSSELLSALGSNSHAKVFAGVGGTVQQNILRDWLTKAAGEIGPPRLAARDAASPRRPAAAVVTASLADDVETEPLTKAASTPPLKKAASTPRLQSVPEEKEVVMRAVKESLPDPFDPDEFNRAVHGSTPLR
jgi:hypothetical protein